MLRPVLRKPSGPYLDYAASTPMDSAVVDAMSDWMAKDASHGNPASTHAWGRAAADQVEFARDSVASLLRAEKHEIIWTSGATEAINLALKGVALGQRGRGRHIVTSELEHPAALDSVAWLAQNGFSVSYVEHDEGGVIAPEQLERAMRSDTALVSLMQVNNETGVVTDTYKMAEVAHAHGALLHVDAVQGMARWPVDHLTEADFVSISAHKMYGPKGIGALRAKRSNRHWLEAQTHGGGHEGGLRPGTLPTHQIIGMGVAAQRMLECAIEDAQGNRHLDAALRSQIDSIEDAECNGDQSRRAPGILNVAFEGVAAESLLLALGGMAIATGSACTSADVKPSHVLTALGLSKERALSSVRFSFGRFTTLSDIALAGHLVREAVLELREVGRPKTA